MASTNSSWLLLSSSSSSSSSLSSLSSSLSSSSSSSSDDEVETRRSTCRKNRPEEWAPPDETGLSPSAAHLPYYEALIDEEAMEKYLSRWSEEKAPIKKEKYDIIDRAHEHQRSIYNGGKNGKKGTKLALYVPYIIPNTAVWCHHPDSAVIAAADNWPIRYVQDIYLHVYAWLIHKNDPPTGRPPHAGRCRVCWRLMQKNNRVNLECCNTTLCNGCVFVCFAVADALKWQGATPCPICRHTSVELAEGGRLKQFYKTTMSCSVRLENGSWFVKPMVLKARQKKSK